ncbi:MAG: hypothetical protein M3N95_06160 [Actinomycetota bacterium]|nr:hypothetical protein [Actinomycetota bacterium]
MNEDLFFGLFDDAGMFPPASLPAGRAVFEHARHSLSWYDGFVGPLVCHDSRLGAVDEHAARLGLPVIDVTVVVPEGLEAVAKALDALDRCPHLKIAALDAPLGKHPLRKAVAVCERVADLGVEMYLEIPITHLDDRSVHALCAANLAVKLRTGGTTTGAFHTEDELARAIVLCAAERLPFKCTAGLHNAVRHRDRETKFEHHGFLNIALAALAAAGTGSVAVVREILAERDPMIVAARTRELSCRDVAAIRSLFASFGTCSVTEPVDDLISMGLVTAA